MQINWQLKRFNDLWPGEVYKILQLRNEVFVVEQNCVFQDADDKDQESHHLMGFSNDDLLVYCRLVPPGVVYSEASIGRVVNSSKVRGKGLGKGLMERAIEETTKLFGAGPIKLGAQLYLKNFYNSLGFEQTSSVYLEDGIEHIYMIRM